MDRTVEALIAESCQRHSTSRDVSVHEYVEKLTVSIGRIVEGRIKLYLDTRYWVFLRNAALGREKRREHSEILTLLRRLVRDGVAICPVSDVALVELTNQSDPETRAATASLLDELSLGVALIFERERVHVELEHFFRAPAESVAKHSLRTRVWTKAGHALGTLIPSVDSLPGETLLLLQKVFVDTVWASTFSDLFKMGDVEQSLAAKFNEMAAKINVEKERFRHEVSSFQQALGAELAGALRLHEDFVSEMLLSFFEEQGNSRGNVSPEELIDSREKMTRVVVNGFRYRKGHMASRLPTVYIHAACHAAVRMDANRKFNGNFIRDLHHGCAGVGYHDAMFTENPLRVLLTSGNVDANRLCGCVVLSSEVDVVAYLRELER
ncbi:hypothetical protein [Pandoraea anhela]|uniref:Uncharacterized protein n=1 Tax=Pandoraea anhela TaxID=2508295 RepID=A0A5E4Z8T6_9BURK|nr:hypothetical protein [Pandoraea anhela]VVE57474.1 hypothetical protein PAN31108_05204 [Pandoraea anhela]